MNEMQLVQKLHMQESAFLHINIFVCICSSFPIGLYGELFWFFLLFPPLMYLNLKNNLRFVFHG